MFFSNFFFLPVAAVYNRTAIKDINIENITTTTDVLPNSLEDEAL